MRLLGSLIDFERALAGRDDPVADQSDMFARVAHVDLGSFRDVESKLLATVVVSLRGCRVDANGQSQQKGSNPRL